MDVEIRVGRIQVLVKPPLDLPLRLEIVGEVNSGLRGEGENTLMIVGELVGVGVIERGERVLVVLQPLVDGRGLRVEGVVEKLNLQDLPLIGGWTVTSSTDSLLVSSVASTVGPKI